MEYIPLVVILAGLVILFLWSRKGPSKRRRVGWHIPFPKKSRRDEKYGRLLCQVLGDRKKALRLIVYEKAKNPKLSEEECIEMASNTLSGEMKRWD
jgi:hypothetical protein